MNTKEESQKQLVNVLLEIIKELPDIKIKPIPVEIGSTGLIQTDNFNEQ